MAYMVWRCLFAVALLSVLVPTQSVGSDGGSTGGNDILRVGFERPEYSVERGEGSVKVKLVFSDYNGDKIKDDGFELKVTAEDGTAEAEVDYHYAAKLYAEEFKIKSHYRNIHVQILLPPHDSPSTDCTTSSKTFSLSLLVEGALKTSVELSPHPTTTIIIIDDPQGGSVDECWRRKCNKLEETLTEVLSSKIDEIRQLNETLKSKEESCPSDHMRVGFERPEYSVGRGGGSVKVKLVFSDYTGDRSVDDSFKLRVAAEDGTAVAEVDYHFDVLTSQANFKKEGQTNTITVQIKSPPGGSPSADCTTSSKTFSLSLLAEGNFNTSVELSPHPTTTITIIDDPHGGSVDECWRRKCNKLEETLTEVLSSKIDEIRQLNETLKSKEESCSDHKSKQELEKCDGTDNDGSDSVRVGFERPEYSVGRGEGSVKVKLVFSAYTGDRSEDDGFILRIAAEDVTAVAEVDYHFDELTYLANFKEEGQTNTITVQIKSPPGGSPSADCTTSSKTFSLSLLAEGDFKTSVELSPHPTTTITIIDDPQGGSVDECWRRKLADLKRTFSEILSSKIDEIDQLKETLKSKQESCHPDPTASPPTDVSAVLEGTRLTVSWKKPEAGPVPIGYVIYYKKEGSYSTQEGSGGWEGEKSVIGCPNEDITACSISLTTRSGATNYVVSVATFSAQSAARPAVLRAKPPNRIWASLKGTNLTVIWRQPEGVGATLGDYTHMYIIYYRAGSGGVEGSVITSGCTHLDCSSTMTGIEADSANYTVTMAAVHEDNSLSYRTEATVAVRATANPPYVTAKLEGTRLTVSWRKPYGAATPTGYEVHYRTNSEKSSDSKLEWKDTFLVEQKDADYFFQHTDVDYYRREYMHYRREYHVADATANYSVSVVTVSEGNFNSPPSTEVMAERQGAEPPNNVSASLEGTRLSVSWKKPVGGATPTGYEVYYGVNYYRYQDDDHTYVGLENCSDYAEPSCSTVLVIANATESYFICTEFTW